MLRKYSDHVHLIPVIGVAIFVWLINGFKEKLVGVWSELRKAGTLLRPDADLVVLPTKKYYFFYLNSA